MIYYENETDLSYLNSVCGELLGATKLQFFHLVEYINANTKLLDIDVNKKEPPVSNINSDEVLPNPDESKKKIIKVKPKVKKNTKE